MGLLLGLLLGLSGAAMADGQDGDWRVFGAYETRNENLEAFTKWRDVLDRHATENAAARLVHHCQPGSASDCRIDRWRELLNRLSDLPARQQVDLVNAFFNDVPYIADSNNWGVSDYWATVGEFLERGGDCEDYAIAKYVTLKQAGFDPRRLRLAIVEDLHLQTPHAVLLVRLEEGVVVLDNQIATPVKTTSIIHYRPIYSINEDAWWLHRMPLPEVLPGEQRTILALPDQRGSEAISAGLAD